MELYDGGEDAFAVLRKIVRELEVALVNCNELYNKLFEFLNIERVEYEIKWIREIYARYNEMSGKIELFIVKGKNVESA